MRMTPVKRNRTLRGMGCSECGDVCGKGLPVGRSSRGQGLGDWGAILGQVASAYMGGAGGGSGGAVGGPSIANRVDVSPTIITGVSPQISPVFQQQYQPTNSGLTASTSQGAPDAAMAALGVGNTSYPAGYPIAQPYASPTVYSDGLTADQIIPGVDNTVLAVAGLGVIWYMTKGKSPKKGGKKAKAA
jgi:hypothetical protein